MYLQLMTHEVNEIYIKKTDLQNCQIKSVSNETNFSQHKILKKKIEFAC